MKVLHFFKAALPDSMGGIEQVIHQLAVGGINLGVETQVLALTHGKTQVIEEDGYRVHLVKSNFELASTGFSWAVIKKFAQLSQKADLIHYHYPWPFMDLVHFLAPKLYPANFKATNSSKPTLLTYHSDIVKQKNLLRLYRPLQQRFLQSVDKLVVTSPNYLASSSQLKPFQDKTAIIPLGIDKNSYPQPSAETKARWQKKLGTDFFLFIGVLRYYKGLHSLLEAMQGKNYPLVIAGTGPLEAELKAQAKELGLTQVHFLGKVSEEDKTALLQACRGIVFPSHLRSEAFGITLLEGAMYSKPLISCEIGTGTTYVNQHQETGLVVEPNNSQQLAAAMDSLWHNLELAEELGKKAEERYQQLFTADKMVADYVKLYQQLIANSQ